MEGEREERKYFLHSPLIWVLTSSWNFWNEWADKALFSTFPSQSKPHAMVIWHEVSVGLGSQSKELLWKTVPESSAYCVWDPPPSMQASTHRDQKLDLSQYKTCEHLMLIQGDHHSHSPHSRFQCVPISQYFHPIQGYYQFTWCVLDLPQISISYELTHSIWDLLRTAPITAQ